MQNFKILFILIAVFLLIAVFQRNYYKNKTVEKTKLGPTPTVAVSPVVKISPQPTLVPQDNLSPVPTGVPSKTSVNNNYIYPNSFNINQNGNEITLESSDDPQVITDWYKGKIQSLNLSAKSFVQTNANDNVLNKLVASNGNREIRVEISKGPQDSTVNVKIFLQNL